MKYLMPLAAIVTVLTAADADNSGSDNPRAGEAVVVNDNECIQGIWVVTVHESAGKRIEGGSSMLGSKLTFKDATVSSSTSPEQKGTFTLAPDKELSELDFLWERKGAPVKVTMLCQLKGDTLLLCFPKPPPSLITGMHRPKEFTSKDGQTILTLKRAEKWPEK